MVRWLQGKVIEQKIWEKGLNSLFIECALPSFTAGQFVNLSLDSQQKLFRPYSLVNAPSDPILEVYYNPVPEGKFSPKLGQVTSGEPIWISNKAMGRFILQGIPSTDTLWLMATGTGLGVFLSILKTHEPWERFKSIVLIHSVRFAKNLTHQSLINQWQTQYSNRFHWIPIVTGETIPHVLHSRISILLDEKKLEAFTGLTLTPDNSQVMLCGSPQMIKDVCTSLHLKELGIHHHSKAGHITIENYWK